MPSFHAVRLALAGVALGIPFSRSTAQTMRSVTIAKQLRQQPSLLARVRFAGGALRIAPGAATALYRMQLDYDADRFIPLSRYDEQTGEVALGLDRIGSAGLRVSREEHLKQSAVIEFPRTVDLALDLQLGAVDADLELGGLRLSTVRLASTGSRTVTRFSKPNPRSCEWLRLNAGATDFAATGLGNSRCREIEFSGGVGAVDLDLTGSWTEDARVTVEFTVGELTLTLPQDVGFSLTMDRFLSRFEPEGFTRSGNTYRSQNYDQAQRKVEIHLTSNACGVRVKWVGKAATGGQ